MISSWLGPPFIYFWIWKFDQIPPYFKLICSLFLYHGILRFPQIKSVQACAPQTSGDSLKKPLPPTRAPKNMVIWETERETERERPRERERERERERDQERETERERPREIGRGEEKQRETFCGRLYRNSLKLLDLAVANFNPSRLFWPPVCYIFWKIPTLPHPHLFWTPLPYYFNLTFRYKIKPKLHQIP